MINSSLFYNSVEPYFILNDLEVLDMNPAFQKSLHLNHKPQSFYQLSDLMAPVQPGGICSVKLLQKAIFNTYKTGNYQVSFVFSTEGKNNVSMDVLFTSFTSDDKRKMIFGSCRNIHELKGDVLSSECLSAQHEMVLFDTIHGIEYLVKEHEKIKPEVADDFKVVEAFKKSDIKFRVLAEATPAVIMQFDPSLRHIYVNSKVKEITGIPAHEYINKTYEEMDFPLSFVDQAQKCLLKVLNTKSDYKQELVLPNGKHVDWNLVPVFDQNQEVKSIITSFHDITSLKKVEDEVRQAKEKLTDAMKMAQLSTWEYDLDSRKMILSPDYMELFGVKPSKKKISGKYLLDFHVYPEDKHLIINAFQEAVESKESDYKNYIEYRGLSNGKIIHILASLRVIKNNLGIIVKCYGTVQDLTQIRKNEQELKTYRQNLERLVEERTVELQKSEAKLTDALKLVSLGTWEYDFSTKRFFIGDEVVSMINPDEEGGFGNSFSLDEFYKYLHPDDLRKLQNSNSYILKIKDPDFIEYLECRIIRPDGDVRNLYISLKILLDKNGWHLKHYGTIQDITNIRRTEAEKERLMAISEATSDIILITNKSGGIIYLNEAGKMFFDVEKNVELSYLNINLLQNNKKKKILKKAGLKEAIRNGIWSGENLIYGKSGRIIPVSQVIIAHQNESGGIECFSTILRDISSQKKIEQDLLYKNNELDTFVYRASHDLRGPIASLLGLHTIVKYEISDPVPLRYFEMYNQQILRLNNIILSLIEISRIKDREANKVTINFKTIIDECINSFVNLPNFSNIIFKIQVDDKLDFKSDISIITTIIQNLIENAIKYSKPEECSDVTIEVKEHKGGLSIKVADNGIGIDPSIQDKIFDMFFRGTEEGMGSGLGLYILKSAVEKLKGQILLDSFPERGTTFEIIFPY